MTVEGYEFPSRFLVIPNVNTFFGEVRSEENVLEIVASSAYGDVAEFQLTRLGAIGFHFLDGGYLRSLPSYKIKGSGTVPEYVAISQQKIVELQGKRVAFANFLVGAIWGHLCALRHQSLEGANNVNMADILGFGVSGNVLAIEKTQRAYDLMAPKLKLARDNSPSVQVISSGQIGEAIKFVTLMGERSSSFEYADLELCVAMNYQAAILHGHQHAAASFAINFSVAEALVHEIFLAYGLVGSGQRREYAKRSHSCCALSKGDFKSMRLADRISILSGGGLFDMHLRERLDKARKLRNQLMHNAAAVTVSQSGELQTVVRDLWAFLIGCPFELNSAYTMRF